MARAACWTRCRAGDDEKFATCGAYYGFMWGHPGKKLLFMGQEFAQGQEWKHAQSLDWHLLDIAPHRGMQTLVRDLNRIYRETPALHLNDTRPEGFAWIEANDAEASVYAWARKGARSDPMVVVVVSNMTPVERRYRLAFRPQDNGRGAQHPMRPSMAGAIAATWEVSQPSPRPGTGSAIRRSSHCPPLSTIMFRQG